MRFATDQTQATTLRLLAECFETLGGVPAVVLADRMNVLRGAVVANVVVPAPAYLRFAAHYGFRPDFCEAADPESKGMVEALVGYAKRDLVVPNLPWIDIAAADAGAAAWCTEVNARVHSEIAAVPAERLLREQPLLRALPSRIGQTLTVGFQRDRHGSSVDSGQDGSARVRHTHFEAVDGNCALGIRRWWRLARLVCNRRGAREEGLAEEARGSRVIVNAEHELA